jgi:glycosyltransferase involved in cell wall biosynthesis
MPDAPTDRPRVSVLIPAYGHEPYVEAAIRAVWSQDWPLELIVCDDASPDGTYAVLERLARRSPVPMTLLRNEANRGVCATLNRCLSNATGDWVAMTASDDAWMPDYLPKMMAARRPDTILQSGAWMARGRQVWRQVPKLEAATGEEALVALVDGGFSIMAPSMLMPRAVLDRLGGFDETLGFEDLDFFLRAAAAGVGFVWRPEPLVAKRVLAGSLGDRVLDRFDDAMIIYARALSDRPDLFMRARSRRQRGLIHAGMRDGGDALRRALAELGRPGTQRRSLMKPALTGLATRLFRAMFGPGRIAQLRAWRAGRPEAPPRLPL